MSVVQAKNESGNRAPRAKANQPLEVRQPRKNKHAIKREPRAKVIERVVSSILEHELSWDELHRALMRTQAEKLIQPVREVIAGREFKYLRLGEYVIAMHQLCGGLPVVKYKDEAGATVLTRINAGVIQGYLEKGESAERVAEGFDIPVEAVREVGQLATLFDYDRRYA